MLRHLAAAAALAFVSSSAFAQVIYQPVRSQFDSGYGDRKYYYGGTDPRVHNFARYVVNYGYATNLHRFDGGNSFGQPSPLYGRDVIFTDAIPFEDASRFGFTPADAQNEANANAPLYFRKRDLINSALVMPDGSRVVPANGPLFVAPAVAPMYGSPSTQPMSSMMNPAKRGQIIIIPKKYLDQPLKNFEKPQPQKVASAN